MFFSFPQFSNRNEAFDGILSLGNHLIVLEYKGGFLKEEAKYRGKLKSLEAELDRKVGGGVVQIVKKLEKLFQKEKAKRQRIPELAI